MLRNPWRTVHFVSPRPILYQHRRQSGPRIVDDRRLLPPMLVRLRAMIGNTFHRMLEFDMLC